MKICLLTLLLTINLFAVPLYEHEDLLIDMIEYPTNYQLDYKLDIHDQTVKWVGSILRSYACKKRTLSKSEEEYIFRIVFLACEVLNIHEEKELTDIPEDF